MPDKELEALITETKEVWFVWGNTDDTEGRGREFVKYICEIEATAIRLGRNGYVQRGDCPITKALSVRINGSWCGPVVIEPPSQDDNKNQEKLNAKRKAYEKAISAGLSDEDLKAMGVYNA
jgi:hypothetical protein